MAVVNRKLNSEIVSTKVEKPILSMASRYCRTNGLVLYKFISEAISEKIIKHRNERKNNAA